MQQQVASHGLVLAPERALALAREGLVEVPLRRRSGEVAAVALIDLADAAEVNTHRWHVGAGGYVSRAMRLPDGRWRIQTLHRQLMGCVYRDGRVIDHHNHDRLDCRRANLREASYVLNGQNRRGGYGKSACRGVAWYPKRRKWGAQATVGGVQRNLGYFDDAEAAAAVAAAFRAAQMPFSTN